MRAFAWSMSSGEASSSAQESEQNACSPFWSVCRACAICPSTPSGMLLRSLTVIPAPLASRGVSVPQRPIGGDPAVVEIRLAEQLHVDRALNAEDDSHEQVMGVIVRGGPRVGSDLVLPQGRPDGQRVPDEGPAARSVPGGVEDVCAGLVDPVARDVDPEGGEAERPRFAVEQRPEDAGRVEPRHAEPVDRPVGRHQRAGVTVGEKGVVGDRGERRRHRRALRHSLLRAGRGLFAVSLRRRLAAGAGLCGALPLRGTHDPVHGSCQPP